MTKAPFKLGQHVTYTKSSMTISAIVRRLHRDGSVTVEATFVDDQPPYLGFKYRMYAEDLHPRVAARSAR